MSRTATSWRSQKRRLEGRGLAPSILIIEQNEQIRELVGRHLGASNFEVTGVGDGLAAAKQLRQKQADLIIIDEDVPMGGIKTARVLRLHTARVSLTATDAMARAKST